MPLRVIHRSQLPEEDMSQEPKEPIPGREVFASLPIYTFLAAGVALLDMAYPCLSATCVRRPHEVRLRKATLRVLSDNSLLRHSPLELYKLVKSPATPICLWDGLRAGPARANDGPRRRRSYVVLSAVVGGAHRSSGKTRSGHLQGRCSDKSRWSPGGRGRGSSSGWPCSTHPSRSLRRKCASTRVV